MAEHGCSVPGRGIIVVSLGTWLADQITMPCAYISYLDLFLDWLFLAAFLQGNNGLKPKDNEFTSKPWHWPINYQVGPKT